MCSSDYKPYKHVTYIVFMLRFRSTLLALIFQCRSPDLFHQTCVFLLEQRKKTEKLYRLCFINLLTPSSIFLMAYSHFTGTGLGQVQGRDQWVQIYYTEMFILVRDRERNQDSFFRFALIKFPVPVLVPFTCSMNKQ